MHALAITFDTDESCARSRVREIDSIPDMSSLERRDLLPVDAVIAHEDPRAIRSMRLSSTPLEDDPLDLTELWQFDLEPREFTHLRVEVTATFLEHTPMRFR